MLLGDQAFYPQQTDTAGLSAADVAASVNGGDLTGFTKTAQLYGGLKFATPLLFDYFLYGNWLYYEYLSPDRLALYVEEDPLPKLLKFICENEVAMRLLQKFNWGTASSDTMMILHRFITSGLVNTNAKDMIGGKIKDALGAKTGASIRDSLKAFCDTPKPTTTVAVPVSTPASTTTQNLHVVSTNVSTSVSAPASIESSLSSSASSSSSSSSAAASSSSSAAAAAASGSSSSVSSELTKRKRSSSGDGEGDGIGGEAQNDSISYIAQYDLYSSTSSYEDLRSATSRQLFNAEEEEEDVEPSTPLTEHFESRLLIDLNFADPNSSCEATDAMLASNAPVVDTDASQSSQNTSNSDNSSDSNSNSSDT